MVLQHLDPLPVVRVDQLPREEQTHRWLVEPLWGESSVGEERKAKRRYRTLKPKKGA